MCELHRVFLHGNGRKTDRITVFIFIMASSAILKQYLFFEEQFDNERSVLLKKVGDYEFM